MLDAISFRLPTFEAFWPRRNDPIAPKTLLLCTQTKDYRAIRLGRISPFTLKDIQEAALASDNLEALMQALEKGLSLEKLEELTNLSSEKLLRLFPGMTLPSKSWKNTVLKVASILIRIIPDLIDTCVEMFELMRSGRGRIALFDFLTTLSIYAYVFATPIGLFSLVRLWIQHPSTCLAVTSGIIVGLLALLQLYLKFRPCPKKICPFKNLSVKKPSSSTIQAKKTQEILSKIDGGLNVLLIGKTGIGKTELAKSLSFERKDKIFFYTQAKLFTGQWGSNYSSEVFLMTVNRFKSHRQKVILIIDDLHECPKIYDDLKYFLDRHFQIVGIATEEPNNLESIDRLHIIKLEEPKEAQIQSVFARLAAVSPFFLPSGFEEAVLKEAQAEGMNFRNTLDLFKEKQSQVKTFWQGDFKPARFFEIQEELANIESHNHAHPEKAEETHEKIEVLLKESKKIEEELKPYQTIRKEIQAMIPKEAALRRQLLESNDKKRKLLSSKIYAAIRKKIEDLESRLPEKYRFTLAPISLPKPIKQEPFEA